MLDVQNSNNVGVLSPEEALKYAAGAGGRGREKVRWGNCVVCSSSAGLQLHSSQEAALDTDCDDAVVSYRETSVVGH